MVGFLIVTIPLVSFLFYNNYYASYVIREQVGNSSQSLLSLYSDQVDRTLEDENNYLYNLATQDLNIRSLLYNMGDHDEYVLTKGRVLNKWYSDFQYNKNFQQIFAYIPQNQDLIMTQKTENSYYESMEISSFISQLMTDKVKRSVYERKWSICHIGNKRLLLRIVQTDSHTYVGAINNIDQLMVPLNLLATDQQMKAYFLSPQGVIQTSLQPKPDIAEAMTSAIMYPIGVNQTIGQDEKYLLISNQLKLTDLVLAILLPEKILLQQVPFFQSIIYLIPVAAGVLLLIYLIFLQKLILKPIQNLIIGMRNLRNGNMEIRLPHVKSREFGMINETFNTMVSQINDLKINVYEEEIRSNKAELKQLQLQINPHFLFNSINIIYSLAETQHYELIKKMARHLVSYFRFLARVGESLVTVSDEMENVDHYLQIQKLRFPKHLDYDFTIEDSLWDCCIPPLIIQTFVENSIKYGFTMGDSMFIVSVKAALLNAQGKVWCEIAIEDNGTGFPAELLEDWPAWMEHYSKNKEHIGIWNVLYRLNLQYRHNAELILENKMTGGARVRILIPIQLKEKVGDDDV
jgi:two-component system sensor histidine kinase YesM